jgi:NAD+ synthase (glutamine-hydrolysing)
VLNTGNKSELAMGYTTLYGDAVGSIAVLGDLLKHQVYEVAAYINRKNERIPLRIITKAPSAELRPHQKDSDTLPEYPILDPIVQDYVVENLTPSEIAKKHGFDEKLVQSTIQKIHAMEYKRRQMPFALRVSDKAFSVGRRVPIVHK